MPKINVYLPDDLAEAVKESGVPVSAICQRALEQAVRRVTAIRSAAVSTLDADELTARLPHFTANARAVLTTGVDRARFASASTVGTADLLAGLLGMADNMALRVLIAMEIDPAQIARDLPADAADPTSPSTSDASAGGDTGVSAGVLQLSGPAVNALELVVAESAGFAHNYVGCEHLMLGLIVEPDGVAGQLLRRLGAEAKPTRRAVAAALSGYVAALARSEPSTEPSPAAASGTAGASATAAVPAALAAVVRGELRPLIERIERLEQRAG